MKKALAIILLLTALLLSACSSNSTEQTPSTGSVTQVTEATETQPTESTMMPENTTEAANNSFSQPATEPSETTGPMVPGEMVKPTTPTESTEETPKDPPPTTNPAEETQPSTTEPGTRPTESQRTEPTDPPEESTTEPTEPPAQTESISTATIESQAESYAASLGFVIDNSLGKGNSGYYPPDYRPFTSMQDSLDAAVGLVSATKNQLNSRFSEERCDVLVDGAYGLARLNCQIVYSHTDELGDWYYTYVFYG